MPRPLRIDYPAARHHVMNRGARRQLVFPDDHARHTFLGLVGELPSRYGVDVHAYALMPNHFHLLLTTHHANLSAAMQHLASQYTRQVNTRMQWDGPLFRGRFRNRVVGDEAYWRHLFAYVHLNPVPSVTQLPEDFAWSSHRAALGLDAPPPWLDLRDLLAAYGSVDSYREYVEAQRLGTGPTPVGWDPDDLWGDGPTGAAQPVHPTQPLIMRATVDIALEEVTDLTGWRQTDILQVRRGRHEAAPRWLAVWWIGRRAGASQREISEMLGCRPAVVSHMLRRAKAMRETDAQMAGWMNTLEAKAKVEGRDSANVLAPDARRRQRNLGKGER